jgi:hypothetical protein
MTLTKQQTTSLLTANKGSYKVSILVRGSNKWADNGLRFYLDGDATEYAASLKRRWPAVERYAVVVTEDPPNCVYPVPSDRYPVPRPSNLRILPAEGNRVDLPCPHCSEDNADKLVWMPDDVTVACLTCGYQFKPGKEDRNG